METKTNNEESNEKEINKMEEKKEPKKKLLAHKEVGDFSREEIHFLLLRLNSKFRTDVDFAEECPISLEKLCELGTEGK